MFINYIAIQFSTLSLITNKIRECTAIKYWTRDTIYILFTKFKILYDTGTTKTFLYVQVKKSKKGFFTYLHFPFILVYTCQTMSRTQRKKIKMKFPQNQKSTLIQWWPQDSALTLKMKILKETNSPGRELLENKEDIL